MSPAVFGLELATDLLRPFTHMVMQLYKLFEENDFGLLEINPLVLTEDNKLVCDAKINIDDNALYRQPQLCEMR